MKKFLFLVSISILLGLFFATTQVLASPATLTSSMKPPVKTPGAQATKIATEMSPQGNGNPHGQSNSQGNTDLQGKRVNYKGTISAVDASSLTITLRNGTSLTFILTADTSIKIPTIGKSATAADLAIGMQVNINAVENAGGLTARSVHVVPGKPILIQRVGTVTDYQPGISITIQAQDGHNYTFLLTAKTKILPIERADQLAAGVRVTIIAPRDVAGGKLIATGIVVHPTESPTP